MRQPEALHPLAERVAVALEKSVAKAATALKWLLAGVVGLALLGVLLLVGSIANDALPEGLKTFLQWALGFWCAYAVARHLAETKANEARAYAAQRIERLEQEMAKLRLEILNVRYPSA
jgi:hypothetical protein